MNAPLDAADAALDAASKAIDAARRTIAAVIASKPAPAMLRELPHNITRRGAKQLLGLETRAFDRAGAEIGFRKPGRELLLPTADLLAWIERQRIKRGKDAPDADKNAPLPFEPFADRLRRKAG